jgi:biopolymer transport protein ExbD
MIRRRRSRARVRGFDLTPMIDVVLQLIIFFMFTSQFGQISRTSVDLPIEPGEKLPETRPSLVIDISKEGGYTVDARPMAFDRVVALVEREAERSGGAAGVVILVRPDRAASAGALNRLADELARIGVRRWSIATRAEGGG